ncbi:MAG TPA: FAD-binding oxidoreductase [Acidimicrobiia bacterium]|nr:FAD-binding oxidoreductase [Acidimicrobiia bacterium]
MKTSCFWTDDYPHPVDLPARGLPAQTDVLIIGGGITGLTAAHRLARAGVESVVAEAQAIGEGASGVNGGMAIYGLKAQPEAVFDRFGERLGRELWDASNVAIDRVEQLIDGESIPCNFARPGSAQLGFTDRDDRVLAAYARKTTEQLGFRIEYVPRHRLGEIVGSDRFSMALTEKVSACLHPAKYTFGLAEAAARAGASLVETARVTAVEKAGERFTATTSRGRIQAGRILVTTNGYTGTIFPSIRRRVVPIGSYSIVTEPLPLDLAEEVLPGNRMVWTARRFLNYFRRTPDNRILMGGRRNLQTDLDPADSATDLRSRLLEFFPQLAPYEVSHVWGGKLGVTFDLLPHIGRQDDVWYAMGYGGHGVALATYLGTEVGMLMTGELDRSPFAEIPHPTRWYYRTRPWFLPLAALAYRTLDRFGR